jgi:hypothetical protein
MTIHRTLFLVILAGALAACDGGTSSGPPVAGAVQVRSGNDQEGTAGAALFGALVVQVVDTRGRPLPGRAVTFAVTSGAGRVTPATVVTDDAGQARALWVLGPSTADSQRVEARTETSGGAVVSATFRATPRPGPVAAVQAVGPAAFTGITGSALATPLRVRVSDALGNPVPGTTVTWLSRWGGGTLPFSSTADASGEATATWGLGMLAVEPQQAEARAGGITAGFTAVALPPADVVVTTEGSGQSTPVGASFPGALWLRVRLPDGRGVWRAPVEWSGDGLLMPTSNTDGSGVAHNAWTATSAGTLTARATIRTAGAPITVQWTGTGTDP